MKKILLLTLTLVLALSADAQTTYRKSWDFTKWSSETVANLMAGSDWSDIEKADQSEPTEASKNNCFWEVKSRGVADGEVVLTANETVIKELDGLWYTNTADRSLAIAVNYLLPSLGEYHGPSYLWLGSKTKNYFVIPHVAPGTTIKMGVESHKSAEARGVELYVGRGTSGTKLLDPDGNAVPKPTTYQDLTWLVPADVTPTNEEDGTVDIQIRNTNGCHLYYITVGDGDVPDVEKAKKVAYVTNTATIDEDLAYVFLSATDGVELNTVASSETSSLEELQGYDAVVISPYVAATDAIVPTLKSAIAYEPVLNMNAAMYEAWGYGKPVATSEMSVTVPTEMADNALFADLDITSGLELLTDGGITGVSLGEYFANDAVLATAGEAVAIHQHNAARNTYLFLPYTEEGLAAANQDVLPVILGNAVKMVAKTKTNVSAVVAPLISQENKNLETVVTIENTNKSAVTYYTTDGSEPTTASTLYTEPFTLTEACTVKAVSLADGYLPSSVASLGVVIMSQVATPAISIEKNADNSVVTLTCATEGAEIYYSYGVVTDKAKAQKYVEPITLKAEPTEIYAFAVAEGYVQSGLASDYVAINSLNAQTIRIDTLTHFDANSADWFVDNSENGGTGKESAYYYWGKNAWKYYSDEVDHTETVKDSQGNDSIVYYYKPDPAAVRIINPNTPNGWILKSAGQVLTGELKLGAEKAVGNGATGRFAETAEDMIGGTPTTGCITFGGKTSGEPYTASIETTEKYAAPFDVVTYVGNGNNGNPGNLEIQVSADGEAWDSIGTVSMASTQRYYKKTRVSCDKTGEYFVRVWQKSGSTKAQVYDIYVLNNGENSKKYDASTVGIDNVGGSDELVRDEIFSVNGVRLNTIGKGINIIRKHYADGTVKTVKVMVK